MTARAHRERTGSADARLASIEGKLTQLKAKSHGDMAMFPSMLNDQLGNLMSDRLRGPLDRRGGEAG